MRYTQELEKIFPENNRGKAEMCFMMLFGAMLMWVGDSGSDNDADVF